MASTLSQVQVHTVFTVQSKKCLIQPSWKQDLYRFITAIVERRGHKVLAINGMPDHIHLFISLKPVQSLADLMREVKGESSQWLNEGDFLKSKFAWQEGYGAFSYGRSQVDAVSAYIQGQEKFHENKSFLEEFRTMLELFDIEYDQKYLFKSVTL